jgi:hypothetical protein
VQAFIVQKGGSPLAFYNDLSDATSIARMSCLLVQSILGDFVMVSSLLLSTLALLLISPKMWRLYVVYDKRFWVVVPAILLVAGYTGIVFNSGFPSHSVTTAF